MTKTTNEGERKGRGRTLSPEISGQRWIKPPGGGDQKSGQRTTRRSRRPQRSCAFVSRRAWSESSIRRLQLAGRVRKSQGVRP